MPGRVPATTMAAWGLVDEVVPAAELDAAVTAVALRLAGASPVALRGAKSTLRNAADLPLAAHFDAETEAMLACLRARADEPRTTT
jgi:enoyl-CoA hydratase/carnithine racemase